MRFHWSRSRSPRCRSEPLGRPPVGQAILPVSRLVIIVAATLRRVGRAARARRPLPCPCRRGLVTGGRARSSAAPLPFCRRLCLQAPNVPLSGSPPLNTPPEPQRGDKPCSGLCRPLFGGCETQGQKTWRVLRPESLGARRPPPSPVSFPLIGNRSPVIRSRLRELLAVGRAWEPPQACPLPRPALRPCCQ